jgi:hypothetical protein
MFMKKTSFFKALFCALSLFCVSLQADNFAVIPGGGMNGYRSAFLMAQFEEATMTLHEAFDGFWGISAGSLPATFFGSKKMDAQEFLAIYRNTAHQAFPDLNDFLQDLGGWEGILSKFGQPIRCLDESGARRAKLVGALSPHLLNCQFDDGTTNKVVILASSNGQPVYYCDQAIALPEDALRCAPTTYVVDAIVNSCSFNQNLALGFVNAQISLFKNETSELMPDFSTHTVVDGFHMKAAHLFGQSPLPLLIKHLQGRGDNAEHNVVLFDNGSTPISAAERAAYNIDSRGIGKIGNINIFSINVAAPYFQADIIDKSAEALKRHESEVFAALNGASKEVFEAAVGAIMASKMGAEGLD